MSGFKLALCGVLLSASSVVADDLVLSPSPPVVQRMVYYGSLTAVPQTALSPIVATQAAPSYAAPAQSANCCGPAAPTTTTYYAPAPVQSTTYYAPAPAPVTTYYAPAPVAVAAAPLPVTTYYAPAVARPVISYYGPAAVPVTTYYAPAAAPLPVTTYYAPAAPVVVAPVGVVRSKVYYPGMPVRNFFKSITP